MWKQWLAVYAVSDEELSRRLSRRFSVGETRVGHLFRGHLLNQLRSIHSGEYRTEKFWQRMDIKKLGEHVGVGFWPGKLDGGIERG
jgi:hypothetical protein